MRPTANQHIGENVKLSLFTCLGLQSLKQKYFFQKAYKPYISRGAKLNNFPLLMYKITSKGKGERKRYTQPNTEFQRTARRDKEVILSEQCKEIEKRNRLGKTRDFFK